MGKKKGKDKNKLARMSEEERLRYLAHRAELEEEAKRRKQQLISTFMKVNHLPARYKYIQIRYCADSFCFFPFYLFYISLKIFTHSFSFLPFKE